MTKPLFESISWEAYIHLGYNLKRTTFFNGSGSVSIWMYNYDFLARTASWMTRQDRGCFHHERLMELLRVYCEFIANCCSIFINIESFWIIYDLHSVKKWDLFFKSCFVFIILHAKFGWHLLISLFITYYKVFKEGREIISNY